MTCAHVVAVVGLAVHFSLVNTAVCWFVIIVITVWHHRRVAQFERCQEVTGLTCLQAWLHKCTMYTPISNAPVSRTRRPSMWGFKPCGSRQGIGLIDLGGVDCHSSDRGPGRGRRRTRPECRLAACERPPRCGAVRQFAGAARPSSTPAQALDAWDPRRRKPHREDGDARAR